MAALEVEYDLEALRGGLLGREAGGRNGLWDFAALLPPHEPWARVSLGEGGTPLLPAPGVAAAAGLERVYVKVEGANPTGAFKDRLNAVTVTLARHFGYRRVLCTSTGNHGVSLAAYAAAAGLECLVACEPGVEAAAIRQMRLHGARVVALEGAAEAQRAYLARLVEHEGWWPSVRNHPRPYANPFGLEGYKTIAFEIWSQLGRRTPDRVFVPTGGGDSLAGVARGFAHLQHLGLAERVPTLVACQPHAADSLVQAWARRLATVESVEARATSAVSLVTTRTGDHALRALVGSAGGGAAVSADEEAVQQAITLLGRDGFCVDPASAVSVAGVLQCAAAGTVGAGETVVGVLTASGLRWSAAFAGIAGEPERVPIDVLSEGGSSRTA